MCDSITILILLPDQSQAEYNDCNYPTRGKEDTDEASSDFRDQYPKSPLTGAGFKITPVGVKLNSARNVGSIQTSRMRHGRVAGYVVDFNPPACSVGHNRLLVNGVPFAVQLGVGLLQYWLADNGCTTGGLEAIGCGDKRIISVTPTFLFKFASEDEARVVLAHYRMQMETLCNPRKPKPGQKAPAYSIPAKPPEGETTYTYTTYLKRREYTLDCYVKVAGASGAFFKRISDAGAEVEVDRDSKCTLRIGVKLNGKWLENHDLHEVPNWVGKAGNEAYKMAFALVRAELRLDDALRPKQLRSPSVKALNLPKNDQTLLLYHLKGNIAREHDIFKMLPSLKASKAYSASRKRIYDRIRIDLDIEYSLQLKAVYPELTDILAYPDEYSPSAKVAPFIYSRVSVPRAIEKLEKLTAELLEASAQSTFHSVTANVSFFKNRESAKVKHSDENPGARGRGVSNVPLPPDALA